MVAEAAELVVVAGHACVDLIPSLVADPDLAPGAFTALGPLEMRCGGSVVNTGEALVALGARIRLVTTAGDDHLGGVLTTRLRVLDPDARIERAGLGTSYSIVLERGGRSRTIWHYTGSNTAFTGEQVEPEGAALVHLGYATTLPGLLDDDLRPFAELLGRVSRAGATSSVDFATVDTGAPHADAWGRLLPRLLPLMDIVSPSVDDLVSMGWLPPNPVESQVADGARRLVGAGAGVAFVTDGERGAHLATAGRERLSRGGRVLARLAPEWRDVELSIPAAPVERIVGTNGAGDTATAGLIHALLNGYTPRDAGRVAVALAAARIMGRDLRTVVT